MDLYNETINILKKNKLQANKAMGQNFLINEDVVNAIIEKSELSDKDLVIEIGPGLGVLTKELLKKAYKVIAIELDNNMIKVLQDRFQNCNNLIILNQDILKVNLRELIEQEKNKACLNESKIENVKIVANLPYYISSPIVIKLLQEKLNIDNITIMVQKEVAERMVAKPGSKLSGSITYVVDYYSEAQKILEVSRNSFIPEPKVESEVIRLTLRKVPKIEVINEEKFLNFIQKILSQRRKTLANVLVNLNMVNNKKEAVKIIKSVSENENIRGENLSLEQFAALEKVLEF